MPDELLPIGSVVRLQGADDTLVMVMGYEPVMGDEHADYLGVIYPVGLVSEDAALAFDASSVAELVHRGFFDEEADEALAAVRRYRALSAEAVRGVRELIDSLTPERVTQLKREYVERTRGPRVSEPEVLVADDDDDDDNGQVLDLTTGSFGAR